MFEMILFGLLGLVWLGCIYMLFRNQRVFSYRHRLISRISDVIDANPTSDWRWRYDEFEEVPYDQMMKQFWKPIRSFYPRDPARIER